MLYTENINSQLDNFMVVLVETFSDYITKLRLVVLCSKENGWTVS